MNTGEIIYKYTCGDCGILALALYECTGLTLVGACRHNGFFVHFGVRSGRKYWDIRGCLTSRTFRDGMGGTPDDFKIVIIEPDTIYKHYERRPITKYAKKKAITHFLKLHPMLPGGETGVES